MSRNVTLSIPTYLITALGWFLMISGLLIASLQLFNVPPHGAGWAGICVTLIGKHILNRDLADRIDGAIEGLAEREIQAFELGLRRADLTRVR